MAPWLAPLRRASRLAAPVAAATCRGVADTHRLAAALARRARKGDVFALRGEVGSGKSEFARGFVRAAVGDAELAVPSPTFLIHASYAARRLGLVVHHIDLYRIVSDEEVKTLRLPEALASGVALVEWPDRLADFAPSLVEVALREHEEVPREVRFAVEKADARWRTELGEALREFEAGSVASSAAAP